MFGDSASGITDTSEWDRLSEWNAVCGDSTNSGTMGLYMDLRNSTGNGRELLVTDDGEWGVR